MIPGTDYAVCCVEVSGTACVAFDNDIPLKYGVDQCIGDTLGPGGVFRALRTVEGIIIDLETLQPGDEPSKLLTAASEFDTYLRANAGRIPNYGERRRVGEAEEVAAARAQFSQSQQSGKAFSQLSRWGTSSP